MRAQPSRKPTASTASIPAPVGGLNARDALANMPEEDASVMTNWFPTPTSVDVRKGYNNYATGFPGWVETVGYYNGPVTKQLFGWSSTSVYDGSASGAIGAAVVTGLTNARWQHVNYATPGGNYLYAVNGADAPLLYDGTTWVKITAVSTPAITGVTASNFIHVNVFKNRLWFTEKNTFKVWYLPVDSVGGAALSINLGSLFKLGGSLQCMANWTINNQGGIDDYACFISTEGEVALYKGTDPASATTWALVGMFRIGRPIGRRCFIKTGSDVIVVCADGAFPMSKALLNDRSQLNESLSDKIVNLISDDVTAYANNFGWQPMLYPIGNKLIINVPQTENSVQYQYVMNTVNGSWTKFTGWNAACWEFFGDGLYFGGNGIIAKADTGTDDNGANINVDAKTAFTYFGKKGRVKRVTMARPVFYADALFTPSIGLNMDFEDKAPTAPNNYIANTSSAWDVSPWDVTAWGGGNQVIKNWQTVNGVGTAVSLRVRAAVKGIAVSWQATDYAYELGGVL